jgi:hypothetical protein
MMGGLQAAAFLRLESGIGVMKVALPEMVFYGFSFLCQMERDVNSDVEKVALKFECICPLLPRCAYGLYRLNKLAI